MRRPGVDALAPERSMAVGAMSCMCIVVAAVSTMILAVYMLVLTHAFGPVCTDAQAGADLALLSDGFAALFLLAALLYGVLPSIGLICCPRTTRLALGMQFLPGAGGDSSGKPSDPPLSSQEAVDDATATARHGSTHDRTSSRADSRGDTGVGQDDTLQRPQFDLAADSESSKRSPAPPRVSSEHRAAQCVTAASVVATVVLAAVSFALVVRGFAAPFRYNDDAAEAALNTCQQPIKALVEVRPRLPPAFCPPLRRSPPRLRADAPRPPPLPSAVHPLVPAPLAHSRRPVRLLRPPPPRPDYGRREPAPGHASQAG